jgi:crotonobetainyl-CoA:carnitine CoA-transferase CaiB-like acyl-CoA transferase
MSLSGVRVLDFSRVLAGPYCSMMLAELGADVIKVEEPGTGDEAREWPPFVQGQSGYFFSVNRSKRSLTLNLKKEGAKQIVRELTRQSDVVLENFAPGVTKRLGIDYRSLAALNPKIVYCSISGFGQTGPYRDKRAYDPILQAMSGIMSVTGARGGEPVKCGVAITDVGAAVFGAFSIVTSLYRREKTGQGQYIDLGMLDTGLSMMTFLGAMYLCADQVPTTFGSENPTRAPSANYKTSDGRWVHVVINDRQWPRLCELLGVAELATDPEFATNMKRVENRDGVNAVIDRQMRLKSTEEWIALFDAEGLPIGPVNSLDRIMNDPHVAAREMIKSFEHPIAGCVKAIDMPYRFAEDGTSIRSAPPLLGEHTVEILTGLLGYSEGDVARLKAEGAVG